MISHKHKFIFFHVPKAAGSSVIKAVKSKLKSDVVVNDQNRNLVRWLQNKHNVNWPNHIHPGLMLRYLGFEKFYSYYKFAFVRNPFDRLVSLYHYTKQKEHKIYAEKGLELPDFSKNIMNSESFKDWILTGNFGSAQADFLSVGGVLDVNYVGKTENLQNDFDSVLSKLNLPDIQLPNANVSVHDEVSAYVDEETEELIYNQYKRDFHLFNYERLYGRSYIAESNDPKQACRILHIENMNDYTKFEDESQFLIHPNKVDEKPLEVFMLSQKSEILYINIAPKNENSIGKMINLQIQNEDNGFNEDVVLIAPKEENLVIKLNPQKQNLIKIKCYLEKNYIDGNHGCGINLNMKFGK